MTRKLQFSGQEGLAAKAVIRDLSGDVWDGEEFVTYDSGDYDDYKIAMTANGVHYSVDVPEDLPVGKYHVTYQDQAGATLTETDTVIFQAFIQWDGVDLVDDLTTGASIADICNLALSHLGVGKEIANLETENSEEAQTCRRFYETVRDQTLRDFAWPFATRIAALALVDEEPNDEWDYSYRFPSNALKIRRILSGIRNDSRQTRTPYKIAGDTSGSLIYTDMEDAEIEYTIRVTNPLRYPPDFLMALSLRLASYIAPRLTGGDPFKLGNRALELYAFEIGKSEASAANEEQPDETPESEFVQERL